MLEAPTFSASYEMAGHVAASPAFAVPNPSSQNRSLSHESICEGEVKFGTGTFARKNRGTYHAQNSRPTSPELTDWLADQLRSYSTKEVAKLAETNERTAENAKQGKSAFNMASLTAICRNDPQFAAAYAEYIGLIRPGEAEFAGALTAAFNAYQRRQP